ncbi:MAG: S9 family peptidase [Ignavibacteriaceae bacterium]|nr:S9 family peptidase [Ignavibacteriaceae bacterium]
MKGLFLLITLIFMVSINMNAQLRGPLTINELWELERINDFDISPDGSKLVYSSSIFSLNLNKGNANVTLINSNGGDSKVINATEKSESTPRFSPKGDRFAYLFEGQLNIVDATGTNSKKITDLHTGVDSYVWSPDGTKILFVSKVYPECETQDCNKREDKIREESLVKAQVFDELMYRHWNSWRGDKRGHLFLLDVETGKYVDLTPGSSFEVPPISLGSSNDFNFSPDGTEVVYTTNTDKMLATSTNNDIFIVNISGALNGEKVTPVKISSSEGSDCNPVYSPDGKYIAFASMERKGFEADKKRIMLYDRAAKTLKDLSAGFDLTADELTWSPDSRYIYFTAPFEIYNNLYRVEVSSSKMEPVIENVYVSNIRLAKDGKTLFFKRQKTTLPYEIFKATVGSKELTQITGVNSKKLATFDMNEAETFWAEGADGVPVQSILIKPPYFDPNKKYPVIFLIHGGPQGHWADDFHYRWNQQLFASGGYVVIAPNPRGSTGYGQKFTDEISGDWGGKVYTDLMNSLDYAIANFPFIDERNLFAAGASYGGYMINWIAGHSDRFNALVSHAGVFNLESMFGTTEELWFPEWEFSGTPWEKREIYEKWSPHRYIHNCKTPVLVVHGAFDFRVTEDQAFQLFTSLQRLGVDSRFLYFPDETHFVAKPQNSKLWWTTVFNWFDKYYKK